MNLFTFVNGRKAPFSPVLLIPFLILHCFTVSAQIPSDYDATEGIPDSVLVRDWLIGEGVQTFNITSSGHINSRGYFSGTSNLGIESGVILASGHVENSEGPNNSGSLASQWALPGDPVLSQLANNGQPGGPVSYDATVLEFDFIPQSNTVEFRYVFGSEEYPNFANTNFNDVFGFFISGPDLYGTYPSPPGFPNGAINIAQLPILANPPLYVSINNINNGQSNTGPCENCQFYVNNGTGTTPTVNTYIQYDGFTTVLIARSFVRACETYHIKLVIGDIADDNYDSGVFLEANSFSSVGLGANVAYTHEEVDTAVEGCNSANVVFKLFQVTPVDYDIILDVGGTALRGIDYVDIPDTLTIPQGQDSIILVIDPIEDFLPEDLNETVTLRFNSSLCPSSAQYDTVTLYIKDLQIFSSWATGSHSIECGQPDTLYASGDGGQVPYSFQWNTGSTSDTLFISPPNPTQYTVVISDVCGQSETQVIDVDVIGPTADACDDFPICMNDPAALTVTGGTSWLWTAVPDDPSLAGQETLQSPVVYPLTTTTYTVTVYDICGNQDTDQVVVSVDEPYADAGADETICTGDTYILEANYTPGGIYVWTDLAGNVVGNDQQAPVTPSTTTTYIVSVTDNCGNTLQDQVTITVIDMIVTPSVDQSIVCVGTTVELSVINSPSTGSGIYTWRDDLNNVVGTGSTINPTPLITTTYICTVDDGCIRPSSPVTVTVNQLPLVSASAPASAICPDDNISLNASGAVDYVWSANPSDASLVGQETLVNPNVSPIVNTVYTLTGTDVNNCVNSDTYSITVKPRMYADFNASEPSACEDESILFSYTGNANTSASYSWDFNGDIRTGQGPHNISWPTMGTKTISLVVTQDLCVSDMVSQTVEINPSPHANFNMGTAKGCVPLTVDFTNASTNTTPSVTYLWDFGTAGTSTLASPSYEFTQPGQYNVSLMVSNPGCSDIMSIPVAVDAWPVPVAEFSADPVKVSLKNPNVTFTSTSTEPNLTYHWETGDGNVYDIPNFTHTYVDSGYFHVVMEITNEFGCVDSKTMLVTITPKYMIRVPTAFTPNGDGKNDTFGITGNGVQKFRISIYNRWGNLVFESTDIHNSWDGKINGAPALPGVYVYHTYFMDDNDEVSEQTGSFTLIK